MQAELKSGTMGKAIKAVLLAAGPLLSTFAFAQVVVTPGSSAAYVFCAKQKKTGCQMSTVGRWMFKLQHESAFPAADSRRQDSFKDDGTTATRLKWSTAPAPVQDRVYVGYGEFKFDPSNPSKGTFSGIVDMPPIAKPLSCTSYPDYDFCTMGVAGSGTTADTPYRSCNTKYNWTAAGPSEPAFACNGWNPNTGVIECKYPLPATFASNAGSGVGNCVAHYVQRRGTGVCPGSGGFLTSELIYQARVYNLQIREVSDFTDSNCTPISN